MATATAINVGIRRMIYTLSPPQYRNYEVRGGQLYKVIRVTLEYMGTVYQRGQTIPFDGGGGTYYSDDWLMRRYFEQGFVDPVN